MWEIVQRHHEEQRLIARNAVAALDPLWSILQFHDLQASTPAWLKAVRPVVEQGFLVSQYVAAQFVNSYRRELYPEAGSLADLPNPLGTFVTPTIPDRSARIRIMVAMKVTGPVWVGQNSFAEMSELDSVDVMARGFSKSTGAATRLILNGGRGMVRTLADADEFAVGIAGVADETACDACKFLTKPILKTEGPRRMDAVAVGHDYCKCSGRLVYPGDLTAFPSVLPVE